MTQIEEKPKVEQEPVEDVDVNAEVYNGDDDTVPADESSVIDGTEDVEVEPDEEPTED